MRYLHTLTDTSKIYVIRADSRLAPSQWETALQNNAVSHWLGASLESAIYDAYLLPQVRSSSQLDCLSLCGVRLLPGYRCLWLNRHTRCTTAVAVGYCSGGKRRSAGLVGSRHSLFRRVISYGRQVEDQTWPLLCLQLFWHLSVKLSFGSFLKSDLFPPQFPLSSVISNIFPLILACISISIHIKRGMWYHFIVYWALDYLSTLGLKLINVSQMCPLYLMMKKYNFLFRIYFHWAVDIILNDRPHIIPSGTR